MSRMSPASQLDNRYSQDKRKMQLECPNVPNQTSVYSSQSKKIRMSQCPWSHSQSYASILSERIHIKKITNVPIKQAVFIQQTNEIRIACPDRLKSQTNRALFTSK